jgi:signal peptidase I
MKKLENMTPDEQTAFYKAIFKELGFLLSMGVFIMTFYSSCYQPYRIPSGSMIPSLMIGDYILVDKTAYGLRLPFSSIYLTKSLTPERGDVVVFRYPENPKRNYIKRVLAVPGDRLEMIDAEWWINGERMPLDGPHEVDNSQGWIEERFFTEGLLSFEMKLGEREFSVLLKERSSGPRAISAIVLGEDEYFLVGDNRDFSEDSRHWGVVHREAILGQAKLVWLNLVGPFAAGGARAKWSRIGVKL